MINATPLRRSLAIQLRVIGAMLMREILTRYGRHNIGFFWLFVEPMLFTLAIVALWSFNKEMHGAAISVVSFAVTGYSSVLLWRNTALRSVNFLEPNLSLMYHRNVKIIDILASRIILELTGGTISFVFMISLFVFMEWMKPPANIAGVMLGWFMLGWFGASLSLAIGAMSARSELVEKIWHPVSYILFPLSGALFMVDWLPPNAQKVILLLPMVHGVEALREGYYGVAVHAHYDFVYMSIFCLILDLIGLAIIRDLGRRITPA
jgi:capsular polysaccharide transport system permease protein